MTPFLSFPDARRIVPDALSADPIERVSLEIEWLR
jgi:hypothetical protein